MNDQFRCHCELYVSLPHYTARLATRAAQHFKLNECNFLNSRNRHSFPLHHRYVITELLQSDLHKIIVSPQHLSQDHIKVFLYQILRGLKYLHSARILHRDIKPGNLLVNSNCVLKICDFGLARVEEPDQSKHMTQEVVTQYYRAPEILMGARHYSAAVDVWSVGCIFGELLGRRILFQAQSPVQQVGLLKAECRETMSLTLLIICFAAGINHWAAGHSEPGGYAVCMRWGTSAHAATSPENADCRCIVRAKFARDPRGGSFIVPNVDLWSGEWLTLFLSIPMPVVTKEGAWLMTD